MLEGVQAGLRAGRLVPPENFHLTLAFLNKHPEPVLEDVHSLLSTIRLAAIDLSVDGLGTFGAESPRSLYAAIRPDDALTTLRKKVRRAAREAKIELSAEKFVPHITLARFGKGAALEDAREIHIHITRRMAAARASFKADSFALYRSDLRGDGPIYEALAEYPLSANAS